MREGTAERGFTLIELMIVVAIVAVLAMVVIPNWMSAGTKSKARTEAASMFSEIAAKQEQFKAEKSRYMGQTSTSPNYNGTTSCPVAVPTADYNFSTSCTAQAWTDLRVVPTQSKMRCQYTITAGLAGTTFTPPTGFKNSQGALNTVEPTLSSSWWTILATCDGSGTGGTNAQYFQSSVDRKIQAINEGT